MNNIKGVTGVRMESATNGTVSGKCEARPQIYRRYERVAGPPLDLKIFTHNWGFTYSTHYNIYPITPRLTELTTGLRSSRLHLGQATCTYHSRPCVDQPK